MGIRWISSDVFQRRIQKTFSEKSLQSVSLSCPLRIPGQFPQVCSRRLAQSTIQVMQRSIRHNRKSSRSEGTDGAYRDTCRNRPMFLSCALRSNAKSLSGPEDVSSSAVNVQRRGRRAGVNFSAYCNFPHKSAETWTESRTTTATK